MLFRSVSQSRYRRAGITSILYPAVKLAHRTFETAARSLPEFDVIVGNVPFGDKMVVEAGGVGEELPENCCRTLHDYFVCRAIQQLRRGGVAVLLTSTGTLGKLRDAARRWLSQRAELVFAFFIKSFSESVNLSIS